MAKYETLAGRPSQGDTYAKLIDLIRQSQDQAFLLGHLYKEQGDETRGQGFLAIGEMFGNVAVQVTRLATSKTSNLFQ